MRILRGVPSLGALCLTLACGRGADSTAAQPDLVIRKGKEAVVASLVDLGGVNPLTVRPIAFTSEVLDLLFLNLFEEQPDFTEHPPTFRPSLGASWEFSQDRKVLTVRLRKDARWSDGARVTAEDVVFSWRAQIDPQVAWAYATSKDRIQEVVALDPYTVRFQFTQAYPYQFVDANDGKILPRHAWGTLSFDKWRESADWFEANLVTSGPFQIGAWKRNQELVLVANPQFPRRAAPQLARLRFRILPDLATQVDQLLLGQVDYLPTLTPELATRLEGNANIEMLSYEGRQYDYICWNTSRQPFDDPAVRRALTLAIDREELVQTLWRGYARIARGPIPSTFWAAHRQLQPWPYDPEGALRLLATRGFKRNAQGKLARDGRPFRFELFTNAGNRVRASAAVLIQAQLARVGIEVVPQTLEIQALTERNQRGDFDATLSGWAVDTTLDLKPYFHSSEIETGLNFGRYRNPDLDALIDQVRQLPDFKAAIPLYHQIQEMLYQEQPYTFLWEPRRLAAVRKGLQGVEPNALSALGSAPRWWKTEESSAP